MNIICWADLQCPYCYCGETNLKHAIEELGLQDQVNIIWKAYEIHNPGHKDGSMDMQTIFETKHELSPEEAKEQIASINEMLKSESGVDIDFAKVHESSDRDAHRLLKLAEDLGKGNALRDIFHDAYFHKHLILSDSKVLRQAALQADLPTDLVEAVLASQQYNREVSEDEAVLDALGAESVPYFIIDGEVVPEHLSKEGYMDVLKRHM